MDEFERQHRNDEHVFVRPPPGFSGQYLESDHSVRTCCTDLLGESSVMNCFRATMVGPLMPNLNRAKISGFRSLSRKHITCFTSNFGCGLTRPALRNDSIWGHICLPTLWWPKITEDDWNGEFRTNTEATNHAIHCKLGMKIYRINVPNRFDFLKITEDGWNGEFRINIEATNHAIHCKLGMKTYRINAPNRSDFSLCWSDCRPLLNKKTIKWWFPTIIGKLITQSNLVNTLIVLFMLELIWFWMTLVQCWYSGNRRRTKNCAFYYYWKNWLPNTLPSNACTCFVSHENGGFPPLPQSYFSALILSHLWFYTFILISRTCLGSKEVCKSDTLTHALYVNKTAHIHLHINSASLSYTWLRGCYQSTLPTGGPIKETISRILAMLLCSIFQLA